MADLLAGNEIPPVTVITRKMGMDMDGKRKSLEPYLYQACRGYR